MPDPAFSRRRKWRFDDDEPAFAKRNRHRRALPALDTLDAVDGLPEGDRWTTWDQSTAGDRGPKPYPPWLVTELAAVDTELGILKTGKEADVFLLRRGLPDGGRSCLLAAKRYRDADHKMFQRDSAYLEGRRVRESRDNRAMAQRTAAGRRMIATQWANAEFAALVQLHHSGVPAPYPVQVLGTELLLAGLWDQLVSALVVLAADGLAHGDLSAYNLMVHQGRLIMIDLPQVVDVIANPRGAEFLDRDAANVARWFTARGLTGVSPSPEELPALLRREARLAG